MSKTGWVVGGLALGAIGFFALSKRQHHLTPFIRGLYGRIAKHFPFKSPPLIEDRSVANAESDGQTIRVNPEWVARTLAEGCNDEKCTWSFVTGVLAHELGHHAHRVEGHAIGGHAEEIRSDEIAGQVLALEGIGREDFGRILDKLSGHGSPSHPDGWSRRQAIERGYHAVNLFA